MENQAAKRRIMFLGDSETKGQIGVDYLQFIKDEVEPICNAENGATIKIVRGFAANALADAQYDDVEEFVLFVGVNDAWTPWVYEQGPFWKRATEQLLPTASSDLGDFEAEYRALIEDLKPRAKRMTLLGCPLVQVRGFPYDTLLPQYSDIIKRLAEEYGFDYIDVTEIQKGLLTKDLTFYNQGDGIIPGTDAYVIAILRATHPELKDEIGRAYGLELTVDGIHLNTASAQALAEALNQVL